jgi:hypothetical protein
MLISDFKDFPSGIFCKRPDISAVGDDEEMTETSTTHQEQFRQFARYNALFNEQIYTTVAAIPDQQRKQDMHAFFGSIHATLNHILLADRVWLGRVADAFP